VIRTLLALALSLLAGIASAAPAVPDGARGETAPKDGEPRLAGRLLVDHTAVRAGETFQVGLLLEMDRHWHVYWRNSGQSGAPPRLVWRGTGLDVGAIAWPFPEVFREADGFITTYGYTGEVLLASPAKFAPGTTGPVVIELEADVLVCEIQCIPGELHLSREVRVGAASEFAPRDEHAVFAEFEPRVPRPATESGVELEAAYSLSAIRPGDAFRAALAAHACTPKGDGMDCAELEPGAASLRDSFVPERVDGVELLVDGGRRPSFLQGGFLVTMDGTASADPPQGDGRLRGALALRRDGATEYVEVDVPLPRAAAGAPSLALENPWLEPDPSQAAALPALPFARAVLLALLGGLVLNLMPCVLPVLAIKVFGLAELAQHGRAELARHGLAYTAGVLASMLALALVVAGLRAAGTSVGWGFQFQEPLFVAGIAAVLVVFALSLFGVFEFRLDVTRLAEASGRAVGARRSFFEGLLAVVLATPCSAPFLGTAIGFAFASPTPTIVAIFLAVGAGLALPFALICAVPGWARLVPRSGPWMDSLRTLLGFAVLGSAVWLLWILGRAAGADAQTAVLAYLCALAAGLVVFGALQKSERAGAARLALAAVALLALVGLRALPLGAGEPAAAGHREDGAGDELGKRFSAADVAAARARGAPVFVYFTAEWCLTCKVNEHVVLDDARVRAQLAAGGFETFKGDWTRRDDEIRKELARFGKAGVPLYLVYGPGTSDRPIVLPELLTVELFLNALHEAAPTTKEDRT